MYTQAIIDGFVNNSVAIFSLLVSVQKRGFLFEIKACEKFYRRRPERSALGVHIVDIPRIKIFRATQRSGKITISGWALTKKATRSRSPFRNSLVRDDQEQQEPWVPQLVQPAPKSIPQSSLKPY